MKMLQAAVASDDGNIYRLDVLEYAGRRWLVPNWIRKRTYRRPARLICIEGLPHQTIGNVYADPPHIIVNSPIPMDVLSGKLKSGHVPGFTIIKRAGLHFPVAETAAGLVRKGIARLRVGPSARDSAPISP